jgi:hypothetical protein
MKLRHQAKERFNHTPFNLEFNDDDYAIATPAFWAAWRSDKNSVRGRTISHQYAPGKYPAHQVGLQGQKPVWVVFESRAAKEAFDAKLDNGHTPTLENITEKRLKGLSWQSIKANGGMFLDDRNSQNKAVIVAWLNCYNGRYAVNVVHSAFKLTRPIPNTITDLGDAVKWVYQNSAWRGGRP